MDINKYANKGLTGLANLGNTCYINSCMQILSHCYKLNELLDKINYNNIKDNNLIIEWKILKDLMWNKNCIISPNRFINTVQNISKNKNIDLFTGFAQNDLHEFLIFIIDCFHSSIKRKVLMNIEGKILNGKDELAKDCYTMIKNMYSETFSEFLSLFYGVHVSLIKCINNNDLLSHKPEPFNIINLSIPDKNNISLYDCFDLYVEKEELINENAWYDEKTNSKRNITKSLSFWSFPEILIIHLKRFNNNNHKINKLISAPLNDLDLSKYVIGYNKNSFIYDLFGVCNHSGGCLGGHYTSYVKNANDKWYHFNDTNVNEIPIETVISQKTYCLFYIKKI